MLNWKLTCFSIQLEVVVISENPSLEYKITKKKVLKHFFTSEYKL